MEQLQKKLFKKSPQGDSNEKTIEKCWGKVSENEEIEKREQIKGLHSDKKI